MSGFVLKCGKSCRNKHKMGGFVLVEVGDAGKARTKWDKRGERGREGRRLALEVLIVLAAGPGAAPVEAVF